MKKILTCKATSELYRWFIIKGADFIGVDNRRNLYVRIFTA